MQATPRPGMQAWNALTCTLHSGWPRDSMSTPIIEANTICITGWIDTVSGVLIWKGILFQARRHTLASNSRLLSHNQWQKLPRQRHHTSKTQSREMSALQLVHAVVNACRHICIYNSICVYMMYMLSTFNLDLEYWAACICQLGRSTTSW